MTMASLPLCKALIFLVLFSSLQLLAVTCAEFEVGGQDGWAIPASNNGDIYNKWASENRFLVNDTVHFKYRDDSVLVVTSDEYDKCKSSSPLFFGNNGDTTYTLDRPGYFYFISGISGHCSRGMKMIIKVLEPKNTSPSPVASQNSTSSMNSTSNAATAMEKTAATIIPASLTVSVLVGALLI